MSEKTRVVLLGASVGREWNLPDLPGRTGQDGYVFEALAAWQFDKSEILEETLMRPRRKFRLTRTYLKGFLEPSRQPADIIVIKECSAYFPGDLEKYRRSFGEWATAVRQGGRGLVLATVVPVTAERAAGVPGKMEQVREFNDWVREYARREGITLLDLEEALRTDPEKRFLRDDLTSGDGTHLNRKAYDILDPIMLEAVRREEARMGSENGP